MLLTQTASMAFEPLSQPLVFHYLTLVRARAMLEDVMRVFRPAACAVA